MTRLVTSLGTLIALMAVVPVAEAGSYSFSIGGHRFHVESPRNCRSASCVSISSHRNLRPREDVDTRPVPPPAPAPVAQVPQPASVAPVSPPQPAVVAAPPAAPAPVLAATTSQLVVPPPAPPRIEPLRVDPPKIVTLEPPRMEPPVVAPKLEIMQAAPVAHSPLGEWESLGAKGTVRIERCGPALCGFALTEASNRGESVLVNMKPKRHDVWTGSIYSRSSGSTYYGRMTLKSSGTLHVEACAIGRFWCSGNDWTRVEEPREKLITTSRQWGARS